MDAELVKLFRVQLGTKCYAELETTWLELLELNPPLEELFPLIELVRRWAPPETLPPLLWVLATSLADQKRHQDELTVLRLLVELTPEDNKLTKTITTCLHNLYPNEPLLDRLLQKAGLGYGDPTPTALARFDQFINLVPGRLVYDPQRGLGKVQKLDLLFDRVTVVFKNEENTTLDVLTASKRFRFPLSGGFFYRWQENPEELKELALSDPAKVITLFLRDIGEPATPEKIQEALALLVDQNTSAALWEKAKRTLSRAPHIVVGTRPTRTYRWSPAPQPPADHQQKTAANDKWTAQNEPSSTLNELMSPAEVLATWEKLRTAAERRRFLEQLPDTRPEDYKNLYDHIFRTTTDNRARTFIAQKLQATAPEQYRQLVESILTGYRKNPEAFLFVAENPPPDTRRQILSRLLDLLEIENSRPLLNRAKKILVQENYRLIRQALEQLNEPEGAKLLERVKRNRTLEEFQQKEIADIITSRFTGLQIRPINDILWSSPAGIKKAKAELERLTQEELPRCAEDLARARSFGDLSENYEYKAAKEKQARLMVQIDRLRADLARAQPIQPEKIDPTRVEIGCRVWLQDSSGNTQEYTILGPWDVEPEKGLISFQSPLAQELIGKKVGDSVAVADKKLLITQIAIAPQVQTEVS